jgi:TAG lipase/steryl ester hydrolase/phospholipase A2/LPA acyltransferase
VASSCSLPLVFKSRGLLEKNPETKEIDTWGHPDHEWIDGSIAGDLPARILERLFNVNHFIASQVNPHVATFLPAEGDVPTWCRRGANAVMDSAIHGLSNMAEYFDDSTTLKMLHSIFSQTYTGDITILPDTAWTRYVEILANPDQEFMRKAMRSGEEATWPKIDRIKNTVAVELALDRAIKHIHGIKVGNMRNHSNGLHRSPSSTRSEFGMSRRSSGASKATGFARSVRGRSNAHRAVKSMVEPPRASLGLGHDYFMSSSDETPSGYSSPITSYDDEDFDDLEHDSPALNVDAAERAKLAFLSQPASPSLAYKAFHFPGGSAPQLPSSPELRRVFNDLHMSAINLPERKPRYD